MEEKIKKAHMMAASHIIGVFRAKKVADEDTIAEVVRLMNWHCEIMVSALKSEEIEDDQQ